MKIRTAKIAEGVYWVEIEDTDFRLLCGCPADVTKHLMRQGFIQKTAIDDVECETGPNAILLTDVMLQGGAFTNLAEFPVLQMLYLQGMIIPGHPNNTGTKPLLIGLADQIERQLNYIQRGNYGLLSKEEILATGVSSAEAEKFMRIKLHFAFGELRPITDLIDSLVVENDRIEIRDGIYIQRTGISQYRIEFEDEFVDVDMTLPPHTHYASPYPLSIRRTYREFFSVIHTGEGDGWDIDRPCMGSIVCIQGDLYLIDAGPNLDAILNSLSISVNELAGVFHTHCHDDHFCGLSALLHADHRIKHFATPMVRASIAKKFAALMGDKDDLLERFFDCIDLIPNQWNDFDGFEVKPIDSPHPVETTCFKFRVLGGDGYKTYLHLADIASYRVLDAMVTDDKKAPGISAADCAVVKKAYADQVNLKKVDVGGGLIHGDSVDFKGDQSDKVVFAHMSRTLSAEEKQTGSGADFGTEDVLIPNRGGDFLKKMANEHLRYYFPGQTEARTQILLNNEIRTFNPHEILVFEGEPLRHLFLIISGNVERFKWGEDEAITMTAGSILGERWALKNIDAYVTYRAASYVRALMIPAELYRHFVDIYGARDFVEPFVDKRRILRRCSYFGDGLTYEMQNRIAEAMMELDLGSGPIHHYGTDLDHVYLIEEGHIERQHNGVVLEKLGPGDIYNEGCSVFGWNSQSTLYVTEKSKVWRIPISTFRNVPIINWKLYEVFRRRIRMVGTLELAAE